MEILSQLVDVAGTIVKRGLDHASDVEVRIVRSDGYGYEVRNKELAPEVALGRVSVGIRALTPEGIALSATTSLSVDENLDALRASVKSAKPTPLTDFGTAQLDPVSTGHDPAWDVWAKDPALLRDLAAGLRDATYAEHGANARLESFEGGVSFGTSWTVLASREGRAAFKRTVGGVFAQVNSAHYKVEHLRRAPTPEAVAELRRLGVATFEEMPERVVAPADLGLSAGDTVPVVIHPRLLEAMIRYAAQEKFLGSSVRSRLTHLTAGARIWDPKITLVDTAADPELANHRPCDDELVPTEATPLVEKGVFESLVWSRRSALEAERRSTGNGYRAPMLVEETSEAPVRDKLSGLVMDPGEGDLEGLLAGVDRGLYVHACLGLHGADRARASFSTTVYDGFAVEDGKITAALQPGSWNVAGHLFPDGESPGLFGEVALSGTRLESGGSRLPWMRTRLSI